MSYKSIKVWLVRFDNLESGVVAILRTGLIPEVYELEDALEALPYVKSAEFETERNLGKKRPQIRVMLTKDAKSDPDGAWRNELTEFLNPGAVRKANAHVREAENHEGRHVGTEVTLRFTYGSISYADCEGFKRRHEMKHIRVGQAGDALTVVMRHPAPFDSAALKRFLKLLEEEAQTMIASVTR